MSNNNLPPGLLLPTVKGIDGTNPRDAAFMTGMNNNSKLTTLSNIGGGRKVNKYYGGFINPQMTTTYPEVGANGQTTSDINNNLAVISTQNASNSSYDLKVGQKAGNKKRRKNKTKKNNRKSRRYVKKSRRYNK